MRRGEIWWASLPAPCGFEPGYRRPILIIQADDFNKSAIKTLICAVLSTNQNLAMAPGNTSISRRASGLSKLSVVNVSQLITIDKSYLTERIKMIDTGTLREVEAGIRLVLDL